MNPSGKSVLITGAGSGIGLSLAKAFKDAGAKVLITGRNETKLKATGLDYAVSDVTSPEDIANLVTVCQEKLGGIDVLINNAGVFQNIDYRTETPSVEEQLKEIDIDLNGPIRLFNAFLPQLKSKSESALVNVSSGLAFVPLASAPIYCATKAALHSWSCSLRFQFKDSGIKIFELMPPLVATPMTTNFKDMPMITPGKLTTDFMKGFRANCFEITPGQSGQLKFMSKFAPGYIFKRLNKAFA